MDRRRISGENLDQLRRIVLDLFAVDAFHRTGIRRICQRAGVSPQTVYKYLGNKDGLLLACVEPLFEQLNEETRAAVEASSSDQALITGITETFFAFYAKHQATARIVFLNLPARYWVERESAAQADYQQLILQLLHMRFSHVSSRPEHLLDAILGSGNRMMVRWLLEGCAAAHQTLARELAAMVMRMLHVDAHGATN